MTSLISKVYRSHRRTWLLILLCAAVLAGAVSYGTVRSGEPRNVLVAGGSATVSVMDFAELRELYPPPPGWMHRKFWTRRAALFSIVNNGSHAALRVATDNSASMLVRFVDIDIAEYPLLSWSWIVEKPIDSAVDERTAEGDDHPARLFVAFRTAKGEQRSLEIIWGNRILKRGDVKFRGTFPHYVANGGNENVGRWHDEKIDLQVLFRRFWPNDRPGRVTEIAVFCDSDETGTSSISYFADIRLARVAPAE